MTTDEIKDLLSNLAVAWARKDASKVASLFCGDGIYRASKSPNRHGDASGRQAIEDLVKAMFLEDDGSVATTTSLIIDGQVAAWRWQYSFTDGRIAEGCDFFEFRDGLIALKDAYRRTYADAGPPTRQTANQ